jgi:hypothetical protein
MYKTRRNGRAAAEYDEDPGRGNGGLEDAGSNAQSAPQRSRLRKCQVSERDGKDDILKLSLPLLQPFIIEKGLDTHLFHAERKSIDDKIKNRLCTGWMTRTGSW